MKLTLVSPAKPGETHRSFRCKSRAGYSCRWTVGKSSGGGFKPMSVGKVKIGGRPIPCDFLPFELMDAVMNRSIRFDTLEEAEVYVRNL